MLLKKKLDDREKTLQVKTMEVEKLETLVNAKQEIIRQQENDLVCQKESIGQLEEMSRKISGELDEASRQLEKKEAIIGAMRSGGHGESLVQVLQI